MVRQPSNANRPEDDPGATRRRNGDSLDDALRVAFGPVSEVPGSPSRSVLEVLGTSTGAVSQVSLREVPGDYSPLVRTRGEEGRELPRQVGRYRVAGLIGRGGMGNVLKARDEDLGRNIALKVLLDEHDGKRDMTWRFLEEAQIAGQLEHPGIVPVYEVGLFAGRKPYFAMKLVNGQTLSALLRERKDPAEGRQRFLAVFEQVCQTLAYAHARGVIHRDLKPSNIMVGAFGEVQVTGFSILRTIVRERTEPCRPAEG